MVSLGLCTAHTVSPSHGFCWGRSHMCINKNGNLEVFPCLQSWTHNDLPELLLHLCLKHKTLIYIAL